jgi:trk system potassium uptake protein TrkH
VIVGLDQAPPGILLWRGLLQWLGGVGIVVMAVALLPFLRVGGMQLFKTKTRTFQLLPPILDLLCACVAFWLAGMTGFEAIHAIAAVSAAPTSTIPSATSKRRQMDRRAVHVPGQAAVHSLHTDRH